MEILDHLNESEKAIVRRVRAELGTQLMKLRVPDDRWKHVALACVVDLSGQVLAMHEGGQLEDTTPPPPTCQKGGRPWPCELAAGHEGPCE